MHSILPRSSSPSTSASDSPQKPKSESEISSFCSILNKFQGQSPYTRHSIPEDIRGRMVDWMIEVLFKCSSSLYTFFRAANYFDSFFLLTEEVLNKQSVHIAGIIAMVLALKFEDSGSVSLSFIQREIGHNKFSLGQLKKMEAQMLQVLQFNLNEMLSIDILRNLAHTLQLNSRLIRISETLLVILKFELYLEFTPFQEAAVCLFISCKSEDYLIQASQIQSISESNDEDLEYVIICVQNKICEYKMTEPCFRCPFLYLGFDFESIDKKKLFKFVTN